MGAHSLQKKVVALTATASAPLAAAVVVNAPAAGAPLPIAVVAGALLAASAAVPRHDVGAASVLAGVLPVAVVGPVVQPEPGVAGMALLAAPAAILTASPTAASLPSRGRVQVYICKHCTVASRRRITGARYCTSSQPR